MILWKQRLIGEESANRMEDENKAYGLINGASKEELL